MRQKVVSDAYATGNEEFGNKPQMNVSSVYYNPSIKVKLGKGWVDLSTTGYLCDIPNHGDRLWRMPEYGMHRILLIYFNYGFRLPMHPFFLVIFEAIGCGVAQMTPNVVAQISGFIARYVEVDRVPSLNLFFSIYSIHYTSDEVLFANVFSLLLTAFIGQFLAGQDSSPKNVGGIEVERAATKDVVTESVELLGGNDELSASREGISELVPRKRPRIEGGDGEPSKTGLKQGQDSQNPGSARSLTITGLRTCNRYLFFSPKWRAESIREISAIKEQQAAVDRRVVDAERRVRELYAELKNAKVGSDDAARKIHDLTDELEKVKRSCEEKRRECEGLDAELAREREGKTCLVEEVNTLRPEVEKGVEEITKSIEVGYNHCYTRAIATGIEMKGHSFDDLCSDLSNEMASSKPGDMQD
ncbi:hypothetical protein POM88_027482 [Heracleum sosnowskyi]|uniref:Transposase (putative) gypsy type domain-containing protein n=1 Tax=Heracleum sosnowskyi TaxID=360622 RepID=A0AAD8I8J7_9APIA|nr:hypothetical protein POM88_027482 [Heracleum sosnowskyi]